MPEESTTRDLVERTRILAALFEAGNREDFDTMMSYFAPDAVWEVVALGTRLEGAAAIRGCLKTGALRTSSSRSSLRRFKTSATASALLL